VTDHYNEASMASPLLRHARRLIRRFGWDMVRYVPANVWTTSMGIEHVPIRTVIDIGAYDGDTGRAFRAIFPEAQILCFEPQQKQFEKLKHWASQQPNVQAFQLAIGDCNGDMVLQSFTKLQQFSTMRKLHPNWEWTQQLTERAVEVTVPIRRLDDAIAHLPLQEPMLIKIDVEGFELEVIAGAQNTLRKAGICIIEAHAAEHWVDQPSIGNLIHALEPFGLQYAGNLMQQPSKTVGVDYLDVLFINHDLVQSHVMRKIA
jgi:FkbM family methyltransferase